GPPRRPRAPAPPRGHTAFLRAVERAGYQRSATAILLEADPGNPAVRDPKAALIRRQARLEVDEDALPAGWWEGLALGPFRLSAFRLLDRLDGRLLARASTWDIAAGAALADGRSRLGLIGLEVPPSERRKGFGRHLVTEILRYARSQSADLVAVQTSEANAPALALYQRLGFEPIDTATLYRLPSELLTRSDDAAA
ncbi:MAG: GNAT family N-acetyltransferase, partial [Isosphaeraceae bacterium]|nr:GNAT family N-acetyltransferase [Isosphaeraceae bacterium]